MNIGNLNTKLLYPRAFIYLLQKLYYYLLIPYIYIHISIN